MGLHRPNPRVDEDVEHVHDDVDHDERQSHRERDALDERGVVVLHALDDGHAHAGQVEDDLDDHSAADEIADAQAQHRDRRDERVAQHVARDDDAARDARADGRAHVVFVELLHHGGADNAGELARHGHAQGERGKRHAGEVAGRILGDVGKRACSRQHVVERHREQQDQQHGQPERRRGDAGDGEHADDLVGPLVAVHSGYHAEDGGEHDGDHQAEKRQLQSDRQCLGDLVADGRLVRTVGAQVSLEQAHHEVPVLHDPRIVQPVTFAVRVEGFLRRSLAQRRVCRIDGGERHEEEDEDGDAEHHDGQGDQSVADQAEKVVHHVLLSRVRGLRPLRGTRLPRGLSARLAKKRPAPQRSDTGRFRL